MIKNLKVLVLALLLAAASCSFTTKENDPKKDKLLISLISYVLERWHYDAKDFDDAFSAKVYDDYVKQLDPLKRYFLASDIEEFDAYKNQIDDEIRNESLVFFDLTYERYRQRLEESKTFYDQILEKPFDFTKDESIDTDYDNLAYAKNKKELKERWEQQLKFNTVSTFFDKVEDQKTMLEDPESEKVEEKTEAELEAEARDITRKSLVEYFDFATNELDREDYFSLYINAIVEEFDPHTYYLAPVDKKRFDMQMSGQFQGIGARLQKTNNEIKVTEVISGGPAWRSEGIQEGDVILKVKQEDDEIPTSVVGMRLDDAVELIKGPKGTAVTLNVKKNDGSIKNITIVRDIVELEETYAKSSTVDKEGRTYGVINLPKFYFDMQNAKERNAATDVKQEIIRLKEQNIEGLVIDLRNNGGGSLSTVVDIAGLFIEDGPIVQVKSNGKESDVLKDNDKSILWDGPLVLLVNEISASASEILAAAMQDYKRAVIIGSKQTYGKGTVQNVQDLNNWLRQNDLGDMGALKITTQKFYRINGGSTQLEGVKSDVVVPDQYSYIDIGEKEFDNPLPWDKISAADYKLWDGYIDYEQTINNSKARMAKNEQLLLIDKKARWIKEKREESIWPLNYEAYKEKMAQNEEEAQEYDAINEYKTDLVYKSLPYEMEEFKQDTILKEKRNRWHKNLAGDVYVEEAINVLEDLKANNIKQSKLANIRD